MICARCYYICNINKYIFRQFTFWKIPPIYMVALFFFFSYISVYNPIWSRKKDMLGGISVKWILDHNFEHRKLYEIRYKLEIRMTLLFWMKRWCDDFFSHKVFIQLLSYFKRIQDSTLKHLDFKTSTASSWICKDSTLTFAIFIFRCVVNLIHPTV